MERVETNSADLSDSDDLEDDDEDVDLFGNNRRISLSTEIARRTSLGLPDNGNGLTKAFYNIDRPMSVSSLVDLIVLRRTGNENRPRRRSTRLSEDLEERIKKTLAWKEMEDELNKEDVMVNFRKKMREMRKEARQSIPKESKIERKINEERRIQLRTSLLEPNNRRRSTTESVKEAIQEFRMRQPSIVEEENKNIKEYEEDKEASDIIQKTRELLEQMGYLKSKRISSIEEELSFLSKSDLRSTSPVDTSSLESETGSSRKRKKMSQSGSEKSLNVKSKPKSRPSQEYMKKKGRNAYHYSGSSSRSTATSTSASSRKADVKPIALRPLPTRRPSAQSKKLSSLKTPLAQRT